MENEYLSTFIKENHYLLTAFGIFAALTVYFTGFMVKTEETQMIVEFIPLITLILMIVVGFELYTNSTKEDENELFMKGQILEEFRKIIFTSFKLGLFFLLLFIGYYILCVYPIFKVIFNFFLFFMSVITIITFKDKIEKYCGKCIEEKESIKYVIFIFSGLFIYFINYYSAIIISIYMPIKSNSLFNILFIEQIANSYLFSIIYGISIALLYIGIIIFLKNLNYILKAYLEKRASV